MMLPVLMQSAPGPETWIDGVKYLYFGGTNYLGLAGNSEVIEAGCEALRSYGVHSATTRAGHGTIPPVLEVERRAAEFFGTDDAYYFSSGYMGGSIVVAALSGEIDGVILERNCHYCLRDAAASSGKPVQTFESDDLSSLRGALSGMRKPLVLADAVAPATGRLTPVKDILEILEASGSGILVLDDAHGFGVLGAEGRGLLEELGLWPKVNGQALQDAVSICVVGTLAKAVGGFGGIIPGSRPFISRLRSSSHYFAGASAPPAAVAGSTAKALDLMIRNPGLRLKLRENVTQIREALRRMGLPVPTGASAQVGISIGDAANTSRIHNALKARGVFVPYFSTYSGVSAGGLLRIAVFADHTASQIERLVSELKRLL